MKRFAWLVLAALCVTVCEQPGSGGAEEEEWWEDWEFEEEEEPPPVVVGMELVSKPDTTLYAKNQEFEGWDGLELRYLYSNGLLGDDPLETEEYTLSHTVIDTSVPGPKMVTVSAGEYTAQFQVYVMVSTSVLQSMTITTPPKTAYYLGEPFSTADMVLSGQYNDGTKSVPVDSVSVEGYDSYKRGSQTVKFRVNKCSVDVDVTVKVAEKDSVTLVTPTTTRTAFIKGKDFDLAASGITAKVRRGNVTATLSAGNGLFPSDITSYDKDKAGAQNLRLTLDERTAGLQVTVVDVAPDVWFDFGYWRHSGDPNGIGPGEGKFYTRPNEGLVLAPVRYLIGYDDDHSPRADTAYTWTVTPPEGCAYDTAAATNKETFTFKPSVTGTYTVRVEVKGRSFVTGEEITKTVSVPVVCHTGAVATTKPRIPANVYGARAIRNFAPGQFTQSGNGYGWSLGAAGGYIVWEVKKHQESYSATGNAFSSWNEPGIVWMQEDRNNNYVPDEIWYEIKGYHDTQDKLTSQITRRYAITYVNYSGSGGSTNEYGQMINGSIYWVDSRGRAARIPGGWPGVWGVTGSRVTFTGTLLLDNEKYDLGTSDGSGDNGAGGYVDTVGVTGWSPYVFPISRAIDAAGNPVTLSNVRFLKVQTAVLKYGDLFGEISTEVSGGTDLNYVSSFPNP